jgi:inhibitor of cysteine peptidase
MAMVVDEQQAGGRIDVPPGEMVTVRLKENATTGYRWTVEQVDGLQLESDHNTGGAGMREMNFRAEAAGDHALCLKLWRDWDGRWSEINRYQLKVHVG